MKIKTNYANTPVWREINVKSRHPGIFEDAGSDGSVTFGGHGMMMLLKC